MKDILWLKAESDDPGGPGAPKLGNDDNNIVSSINNVIYFYSEVNRPKNLDLNRKIAAMGKSLVNRTNTLGLSAPPPIKLHINSFGGSVFAGFSTVDYILNSPVPVHSIIDGCAASAATIMSVVAEKRYMNKHSFMLIHQLSSGMWGKYEEMIDSMENCNLFMEMIRKIYSEHTKIPRKKLDEILKRDLWFDAETCLKYGLIDEII